MKLPEKPISWKKIFRDESVEMFETIKRNKLLERLFEYNRRYLYYSELRYRIPDERIRRYAWTFMKLLRSEKYEHIEIGPIKMKYSILPDFNRKLHHFDKFLAGNIEVQTKSLGLQKNYIISSLMEEAIASSIIEGAATTRKAAKAMLRERRKPRNRSEKMVLNNYETMQFIYEQRKERITPELLLEIQERITKDTIEDEDVGKFRDNNEIVISKRRYPQLVAHRPPDYKGLGSLIKEFCDFANNDSEDFIHPIIKGVMLHFLLGYIHPFNDENGRTARSVFYWYILSKGYWLFEYMALSRRIVRSRKNYDLAYLYTEYDEMDLTYFIKYLLDCIKDSCDETVDYIKKKQIEQEKAKKLVHENPNLNWRQAMILEEFFSNPNKIFTIKEIMETYRVVYQTARNDLLVLAKNGFIEKQTSGRTFVFSLKSRD